MSRHDVPAPRRVASQAGPSVFGRDAWRMVSLFCVVVALKTGNGYVTSAAALLVPLAIAALVVARSLPPSSLPPVVWMVVAGAFAALNASFGSGASPTSPLTGVALTFFSVAAVAASRPRLRIAFAILAAVALGFIVTAHWKWGAGPIDVFYIVQGGGAAVASGHDPYGPVYPHTVGLTFPYGPAVAVLAAPAARLGDARVANLACVLATVAAAGVIARRHAGHRHAVAGTVLIALVLPTSALMVINAWTEVYPLAAFAWWLALRERSKPGAVISLGIALAAKPTIWPVIVILAFWWPEVRREAIWGTAVAAVIALPFAIAAGPRAFAYDVLGEFLDPNSAAAQAAVMEPSLTFGHVLSQTWGVTIPAALSLALLIPLGLWMLRKPPSDLPGLLDDAALALTAAIFLGRWAYFNYYDIPITLLLLAFASATFLRPLRTQSAERGGATPNRSAVGGGLEESPEPHDGTQHIA